MVSNVIYGICRSGMADHTIQHAKKGYYKEVCLILCAEDLVKMMLHMRQVVGDKKLCRM